MNDQQVGTNRVPGTLQLQVVALPWQLSFSSCRMQWIVHVSLCKRCLVTTRGGLPAKLAWLICSFCSFCFSGPINCYHFPAIRAKLHGVMSENTGTKTACTQVSLEVSWNSWWVLACDVRYKSLCPKAPLRIAQQKTEQNDAFYSCEDWTTGYLLTFHSNSKVLTIIWGMNRGTVLVDTSLHQPDKSW